ncbi:MAG: thiamine biosynthesis protein ThiJ [Roseivirga sp.]|nr:thiamine biosynthesis protein ThiJ [Roseivirga sp.]
MKTVAIIVFDKFTDIDVFLPWDLFNRVKLKEQNRQVKFLGTKPKHKSIAGIELDMHGSLDEAKEADIVFFSSGPGTRQLYQNQEYLDQFNLDAKNQLICSMCSGALILAGLGLLHDKTATTYPTAFDTLEQMGVTVERDSHLVVHGNIATAAGCLAAIDLVGWCLDKTVGNEVKESVIASVQAIGQGQVCIY